MRDWERDLGLKKINPLVFILENSHCHEPNNVQVVGTRSNDGFSRMSNNELAQEENMVAEILI